MDGIKEKAGKANFTENQYRMGDRLDNMDERISEFEARLERVEDRYWSQFTAVEKAIQRMNTQSAYLMRQFGN